MDLQEPITTEETTTEETTTEETTTEERTRYYDEIRPEVAMPDAVFSYEDYKQLRVFIEKKMVDGYTEEQSFNEFFK